MDLQANAKDIFIGADLEYTKKLLNLHVLYCSIYIKKNRQ